MSRKDLATIKKEILGCHPTDYEFIKSINSYINQLKIDGKSASCEETRQELEDILSYIENNQPTSGPATIDNHTLSEIYFYLAKQYTYLKQYDLAIKYFEQVKTAEYSDYVAVELGRLYLLSGRIIDADSRLTKALYSNNASSSPDKGMLYVKLALVNIVKEKLI